ncbi:MAG: CHAT domain-containing protein [Roseiflexaceae bacterium]
MAYFEMRKRAHGAQLKLIVIDDDLDWCQTLSLVVRSVGHALDIAQTLEDAKQKLILAEEQEAPYVAAFIDMNFEMNVSTGSGRLALPFGQEAIRYIKANHPHVACIMVSGDVMRPDQVLDLRDEFDLDYYVQKDRLEVLDKALSRALQRVGARAGGQGPARAKPAPQRSSTPRPPPPNSAASATVTLDFQQSADEVRIIWRNDQIGRETTPFTPPYAAEALSLVVRALDVLQYPGYPEALTAGERRHFTFSAAEQASLGALGLWRAGRVASEAYQTVGATLYDALGGSGQSVLKTIRNAGIAQRVDTSFVLRFPAGGVQLAALPWELLWDSEKNQPLLMGGQALVSCERYIDIDVALPPPRAAGERLHILALSPEHGIHPTVRDAEQRARRRIWDELKAKGKVDYEEISPLTMPAINDYLLRLEKEQRAAPDIVHYFGHGTYRNGRGYLAFDNGRGGQDLVPAERLAPVLSDTRLAVIHACQSAMVDDAGGLLTGLAPALSIFTGAIVAMQLTVRIDAATRFAEVFYDQLLGQRRSLQAAVARARRVLFTEEPDGTSWYVPTLYLRAREPRPFYLIQAS